MHQHPQKPGAGYKLLTIVSALFLLPLIVLAANPPAGTITPASQPLTFTGSATATGAANGESTCVEGTKIAIRTRLPWVVSRRIGKTR